MDERTPDLFTPENGDDAAPIESHASQAYLGYAVSMVKARALPEVADGLKPVQRRILYAMGETPGGAQSFSKCARYVGEVLGKYHPHGDTSTYEALVHLAQPFSMRYPLIDGQGNFGSRDGDAPAAYRYTEARLSRFSELLLAEIGEGTVDFVRNYDGKFDEPVLLPAKLPFGLLNGSFGIPVGFSTRIPSHNLKEVAAAAAHVIKHPRARVEDVLEDLPGPDFPGVGQVISPPEEIRQAYETGRGSLLIRCKWQVEPLARGQWRIVVSELPHGVSVKQVQRRILYAMGETPGGAQSFSKCARYVGEVLGKYHPHGDTSTYEALVHLAQPFSMRYPLIDGQGNFGSRDGDAPAAYRYTEARLSRFSELLLAEIGEGTVDFVRNYDGKFDEPVLLPAKLPFGLLNGSFGIPVGFSTRIPSHNLKEVAAAAAHVIKHPRARVEDVLEHLPGPDFPGGGQVISPPEEIRQAYETGRGSLLIRCKWQVEPLATCT